MTQMNITFLILLAAVMISCESKHEIEPPRPAARPQTVLVPEENGSGSSNEIAPQNPSGKESTHRDNCQGVKVTADLCKDVYQRCAPSRRPEVQKACCRDEELGLSDRERELACGIATALASDRFEAIALASYACQSFKAQWACQSKEELGKWDPTIECPKMKKRIIGGELSGAAVESTQESQTRDSSAPSMTEQGLSNPTPCGAVTITQALCHEWLGPCLKENTQKRNATCCLDDSFDPDVANRAFFCEQARIELEKIPISNEVLEKELLYLKRQHAVARSPSLRTLIECKEWEIKHFSQ